MLKQPARIQGIQSTSSNYDRNRHSEQFTVIHLSIKYKIFQTNRQIFIFLYSIRKYYIIETLNLESQKQQDLEAVLE